VIGKENMPAGGPCFIISSHSNPFDGFLIGTKFKEPMASVMTEEYFRGGVFTWLFQQIGLAPTRKFEPQATPVREILRFIKDKRMIVIMPEGERNWDGVTRPTVASTGKLFRRLGVPVHPIVMHFGYFGWPGWSYWPRRFRMYIEFRPPLQFTADMSDEEVARVLDDSIRWNMDWDLAAYKGRIPRGFRPAGGINNLIFRCPHCGEEEGLKVKWGRYLVCRLCDSRWYVGGDSSLTNVKTGERRTSTETFRHILTFPRELRDFGPQGKGYTRSLDVPVYLEVNFPDQDFLGNYDTIIREDRVDFIPSDEGETITIPFEEIHSLSLEKHYRFQIRLKDRLYQLHLRGKGSAIQWEAYLQLLLPQVSQMLIRPMEEYYLTPPEKKPT
jgi:hypothetical protein